MENVRLSNWRSLAWTDSQEFMNFHGIIIGCEEQCREIWSVWKWRYSNKHMKSSQKRPVWNVQLLDGIGYQIHGFRFLQESQVLECGWLRCPGGGDFTQFGSIKTHISKESIEHSAEMLNTWEKIGKQWIVFLVKAPLLRDQTVFEAAWTVKICEVGVQSPLRYRSESSVLLNQVVHLSFTLWWRYTRLSYTPSTSKYLVLVYTDYTLN